MKVYNLKELAEMLELNIQTLRSYIKEGKLKASKIGTHFIVTDEALKEFLQANEVKPKNKN